MAESAVAGVQGHSYVEWGSVIGGTVIALAISLVFLQFGSAVGLASDSPLRGDGHIGALGVVATGIYLLWVQLLSSLAGGYLAGRSRRPMLGAEPHECEMRDGAHGLLSWALATVLVLSAFAFVSALGAFAPDQSAANEMTEQAMRIDQNSKVIFAFVIAASSVVSAAAAWWAGTEGGEHRDKSVDYSKHISFRRA
ncbi:MAG: hypothetical protein MK052_08770 [Alphaproteobacteria bacterium]|nr:hypothetical protein [Alphaproteobacteria bacterium]